MYTSKNKAEKILAVAIAVLCLTLLASVVIMGVRYVMGSKTKPPVTESVVVRDNDNPSLPARIKIPTINVDAKIEHLGLTPKGAMDAPKGPDNAGWYKLGTIPGNIGSAVIDGHASWSNNIPAIFDHLGELKLGDKIYIEGEDGSTTTFVVRRTKIYKASADTTEIFLSDDDLAHLNLITCTGRWDQARNSSADRLVVFADME